VSKSQQAWHLAPERVARACVTFLGPEAHIKLTSRTAKLEYQCRGKRLGNYLEQVQETFALVLQGLYFELEQTRPGEYQLPRPVRTVVTEHADAEQTPPSKGDQVT
jgi:hypothetical protein